MNIETAKSISLIDYLQSIGHTPTKVHGNSAWYCSPLRQEQSPSFKVNLAMNMWYDFGLSEGGNIIKLVQLMHNTSSVSEVLRIIAGQRIAPVYLPPTPVVSARSSEYKVRELSHPALLQFITNQRHILQSVAKRYCEEVHYLCNGRRYFAIAFPNDSGGYALRNKYSKSCLAPSSISSVCRGFDSCYLFEGFMDFLSFKSVNAVDADFVVLNSTVNLCSGVVEMLSKYSRVHSYLDNDPTGRKTTLELMSKLGTKLIDHSKEYAEFKDLNEALCNCGLDAIKQTLSSTETVKPSKGLKL